MLYVFDVCVYEDPVLTLDCLLYDESGTARKEKYSVFSTIRVEERMDRKTDRAVICKWC